MGRSGRFSSAACLVTVGALVCLATSAGQSPASRRWHGWRRSRRAFPLAAWSYFGRDSHEADLATYAQAELTMVQVPLKYVPAAKQVGLDVMLGSWQGLWHDDAKLAQYVAFPQPGDRSVAGYVLHDEPKPDLFAALGRTHDTIYAQDRRDALPVVDMLPNWAVPYTRFGMSYRELMERFVAEVGPAVLVNCHYPVTPDGAYRPEFYANIELFRDLATANDVGLMGFVLVNDQKDPRIPSDSDVRWMAYSYLAYGAKGLWYWNYQIADRKFGQGMVDGDSGKPRRVYGLVAKLNREIAALGPTLMSLRSRTVLHTGADTPPGARRWATNRLRAVDSFEGDAFVVAEFVNQDDPADQDFYVMLVNKRHGMEQAPGDLAADARFSVFPRFTHVCEYLTTGGAKEVLPDVDGLRCVRVGGGNGVLFRFSREAAGMSRLLEQGEGVRTVSVALTPAADVDVRSDAPREAFDREEMFVGQSETKTCAAYIRFDLPEDFGRALSARLLFTRGEPGRWNFLYQVRGIPGAGEWPEADATWDNPPGGDRAQESVLIGRIRVQGSAHAGKGGETYAVKSGELVEFLNQRGGRGATFELKRLGTPSTSFDAFAAREHPAMAAPTLEVRYAPASPEARGE